eukprot:2126087-Amphidinium_carterae.1
MHEGAVLGLMDSSWTAVEMGVLDRHAMQELTRELVRWAGEVEALSGNCTTAYYELIAYSQL